MRQIGRKVDGTGEGVDDRGEKTEREPISERDGKVDPSLRYTVKHEALKDYICKTMVCERAGPANVHLAGLLEVHCQVSTLNECLATAEL
eukprot:scaffold605132_cov17-Prasinocladus_malaysianus.AAC.1